MENKRMNIPGTHIETSPVSRLNTLLDERMVMEETNVMDRCAFMEKFINELTPFMIKEDELTARDGLEMIKKEALLAMQGKKNKFTPYSQEMESELRRLKNDLETKGVIQ
jgi:hypothetical protein